MLRLERAGGGADYLYTGDLWSSAPDGLKSHDLQASHNYILFTRQRQIMRCAVLGLLILSHSTLSLPKPTDLTCSLLGVTV